MSNTPETAEWERQSRRWSVMTTAEVEAFAAQSFDMHDELEGELDRLRCEIENLQRQLPS